jgi:sporulation protein YlmC with PRC-barrel domain
VAGNEYSVGSSTSALQGANILGDNYESRIYMTSNTGGDAIGSTYQANIGFLKKSGISTPVSYTVKINGTGTVQVGNVYSLTIEVVNLSEKVSISSAPKITIYDPLKNLIVSGADATLISDKKYQYNFTTALTDVAGIKETYISIEINGITKQYNQNWTLSNSYTETSINSVNVVSAPVINTNVTITNEGGLSYEYPYEYCIVSVLTQQCGNSGNVAYGSGYKLLAAGQSWNPILSLNVAQSGNYWFKLIVHYGTQNSGATKSFSASYTPAGKTEETSRGTSGGSSEGSSTNQPTIIDIQGSATIPKEQVANGVIAQIETNEKLIINFQPSNSESIESHTVTMSNIGTNSVTLVISSNPITLQLLVGEEKEVDIDGDGKADIYFKLNKIVNGKADLVIKQIISKSSSITGETINYPENLMDVSTRILDGYSMVNPGDKVLMEVTLYNLGTEEIKDAIINYCMKKSNGDTIKCSKETIAIYTKIQLVKEFFVPEDLENGRYYITTETIYGNETAQSETSFQVKIGTFNTWKNLMKNNFLSIILGIITLILLIVIILSYRKKRKIKWGKSRIASLKAKPKSPDNIKSKKHTGSETPVSEKNILINEVTKPVLDKHKKYPSNSVTGLINKKVYSENGNYIGEVKEIILEKNRIESLKIMLDKKYKFKTKGIIINYKHVKSVGEMILVDEKVSEYL